MLIRCLPRYDAIHHGLLISFAVVFPGSMGRRVVAEHRSDILWFGRFLEGTRQLCAEVTPEPTEHFDYSYLSVCCKNKIIIMYAARAVG